MSAVAHDKEFFNDQVKRWWDVVSPDSSVICSWTDTDPPCSQYAHMQFVQVIPASKRMFGD